MSKKSKCLDSDFVPRSPPDGRGRSPARPAAQTAEQLASASKKRTRSSSRPPPAHDTTTGPSQGASSSKQPAAKGKEVTIPKPPGEPGRPGSGGYSLDSVLKNLGLESADAIQEYVKRKADIYLNVAVSFRHQSKSAVKDVISDVRIQFPDLKAYENDWAIRDMLKGYLKYKAGRIRQGLDEAPRPVKRLKRATFALKGRSGVANDPESDDEDELESEDED